MNRYRTTIAGGLAAGAMVLTGCASTFSTQVSNFNQWPANAHGASYTIAAQTPVAGTGAAAQGGVVLSELERKTYEGYLASQLQNQGLVPAAAPARARMVADMKINARREVVQYSVPTYVPAPYYGFGYRHWPYYDDYYCDGGGGFSRMGGMCLTERMVVQPIQVYQLTVRLADRAGVPVGQAAPAVFESTAEYAGTAALPSVVPYLMESVFDGFPGTNGQVRKIEFNADTGAKVVPKK